LQLSELSSSNDESDLSDSNSDSSSADDRCLNENG